MELAERIQSAMKSGKVIIGFRKSLKFIKTNSAQSIIIANNIPDIMKKAIEDAAKSSKIKIEVFNGDSKNLGIICGKPFPISVVVIRA